MDSLGYENYPRIFSLSTLGINYHGYQDYLFHPVRTDFVGESGFGKSMIGDMLQLIFVGASEFRSGTEVDTGNRRRPEGMVLLQKGQNRFGYVFSNIEVAPDNFIVVGMYIEASVGRTSPFIIQAGFDWNPKARLEPLTTPIMHHDFLQAETLLPIESFQEKMHNLTDEEPRVIEIFKNRTHKYHTLLRQNDILPIDPGNDPQKLKNYAQILRAFARGKGFKNDSASLKSFLFGDQDAEVLLNQFESESKQLKQSLEQYQKNKQRVGELEIISKTLQHLEKLSQRRSEARRSQLGAEALAFHQQFEQLETDLTKNTASLSSTEYKLLLVREHGKLTALSVHKSKLETYLADVASLKSSREEKALTEVRIEKLRGEKEFLKPLYQEAKNVFSNLEKMNQWLEKYSGSQESLSNYFAEQMRYYKHKEELEKLVAYLKKEQLLSEFEASSWSQDVALARVETEKQFEDIDEEISLLTSLMLFSDVADPDSLAYWALESRKPLTPEQESVLLHLQALPRSEPERKSGRRFLPEPEVVFAELKTTGKGDDGFWFALGGVYEFVVQRSLNLTEKKKTEIRAYLQQKYSEFSDRHKSLKAERETIERLRDALVDYGYTQSTAEIFASKADIRSFIPDETLPKTKEEFGEYFALYKDLAVITEKNGRFVDTFDRLGAELEECKSNDAKLFQKISDLENKVNPQSKNDLEQAILGTEKDLVQLRQQRAIHEKEFGKPIGDETPEKPFAETSAEDLDDLKEELVSQKATLGEKIRNLEREKPKIQQILKEATAAFENELRYPFVPKNIPDSLEPRKAKGIFEDNDRDYKRHLDSFIGTYAEKERYRLNNETDVDYIARVAFPKIFYEQVSGTSLADQIAKHLETLNERSRELDGSSAETVSRIFNDVKKYYDRYLETIRRLKQFFNHEDTQITGGYRVKLTSRLSSQYPVKWLDDLRYNISLANSPIFSDEVHGDSLRDIVIETFKRHAGGTEAPQLEKLLNPKSYFELDFALDNALWTTGGSEGQAYTAVALLCIARLSVIEDGPSKINQGVKFMPIDEAEGIGSNYHTLCKLALVHGYQVVSMSIRGVPEGIKEGGQTIYTLVPNPDSSSGVNSKPFYDIGYHHGYAYKIYGESKL